MRLWKLYGVVLLGVLIVYSPVYATNGFKTIGVGAINRAMGGAGVAAPQDANAMVINPAGMTELENRMDISIDMHKTTAHMDTTGTYGNTAAGKQKSGRDPSFIPTFGLVHKLKDSSVTLGAGLFGLAGCGVDYEKSRVGSGFTSNEFDKYTDYKFMTLSSGLAYKVDEKLSLGLAANLDYSTFRSDVADSSFAETRGIRRVDQAFGGGFVLGALYKLNQELSLGLCYTSRQWMQEFAKYQDVVPRLDMPQELVVGVGYKLSDKWLWAFDFKWLDWNSVSTLREQPAEGGFGWRDQYVYCLGNQYQLTDKVALRMGYNYGRSAIPNDKVFANALFPAVTEHHAGIGIGVNTSKDSQLSFAFDHGFKNSMEDTGLGDSYSINGKGTKIDLTCNAFVLEWSKVF